MQIGRVTPTANAPAAAPSNELTGDSFLTLLVAQLKAQNPLEPLDPNEFMGQLVQFNSLEQLIQIRQILQDGLNNTSNTTTTSPVASQP